MFLLAYADILFSHLLVLDLALTNAHSKIEFELLKMVTLKGNELFEVEKQWIMT